MGYGTVQGPGLIQLNMISAQIRNRKRCPFKKLMHSGPVGTQAFPLFGAYTSVRPVGHCANVGLGIAKILLDRQTCP